MEARSMWLMERLGPAPFGDGEHTWSRLLAGLGSLGRRLGSVVAYLPGLPTTLSLLSAPPEVRVGVVRMVRGFEQELESRPEAIRIVARRLGFSAEIVGSWVRQAERDEARRRRLTESMRSVRGCQ